MIEAQQLPSSASGPHELVPGTQLGKYEILQRLASGGMAEIFLARMLGVLGFDKLVVIKRILPHLSRRNDFIQMFLDEARIANTLNHANIVQTHEVGEHGKSYFMVMEYLAGEDVRTIMRRVQRAPDVRLPLEHALSITAAVASGLHYAHEKRDRDGKPLHIVHRDVGPQNVIVTWDGAVKLLDFGIAKASNRINETRTGSFKGKVPYMSPEQCRGEPLDRRSDIFSLGILAHEMTLTRRLFRGDTDFQILKQIAEGPIPKPREIDPDYDPRLEAIVMKALERNPAARFQTARDFHEALEELAHERRLRLSPLGLSHYMRGLFKDEIGAWEQAQKDADPAKVEAHFATIFAEREASLASEEGAVAGVYDGGPPPSEVQLDQLDLRPRASSSLRLALAGFVVTAIALCVWRYYPRATAVAASPAAAVHLHPVAQLPLPGEAPVTTVTTATMEVVTTPPGATIVLDGGELSQRTPARLDGLAPGQPHLLLVHLPGQKGVAQRFTLDGGEEASIEIDLRRAMIKPSSHGHGRAAKAPVVVAAPPPPLPGPPPPATKPRLEGDGTFVVASSPWCNVSIDGQPRGTTPLSLKLKAGSHSVTLSNAEFHITRTIAIDVQPNQTVRKSLDFAPE
jgi:serine/threonine protein kinase